MEKVSPDIYSQVKRLEIETNRIISAELSGNYLSAFKGRGLEFSEVRPYSEGDDIRFIDWNVTARMNEPFIKIFKEERELTVFLVIDLSASMLFGSGSENKKQLLHKIAALLSLVSMKNNDRVGLVLFTDKVEKVIPPRKGRKHVLRLIEELLGYNAHPGETDLGLALEKLNKLKMGSAVVFLLSDFMYELDWQKPFEIANRKHDVVPILFSDPLERELHGDSFLRIKDCETGEDIFLDLRDKEFCRQYQQEYQKHYGQLKRYFISQKSNLISLQTDKPYINELTSYFKRRSQRRRY